MLVSCISRYLVICETIKGEYPVYYAQGYLHCFHPNKGRDCLPFSLDLGQSRFLLDFVISTFEFLLKCVLLYIKDNQQMEQKMNHRGSTYQDKRWKTDWCSHDESC